ncbi:NADH:flavin oxidoreductase [Candidatus Latescibacterota bacterium]
MLNLFESTSINTMTLKNRFVRSATWMGMAGEDGTCTPKLTGLMEELAQGDTGLIISGYTFVSTEGKGALMVGASSDDHLPGLTDMADTVHNAGGKIILQLAHCGLFSAPSENGQKPLGPSVMMTPDGPLGSEMSTEDIQQKVRNFRDSADRAKKAGFDGVQIHAAHGYLLSQFLSPFFNKREDEYGGSVENRARFLLEVVASVREAVGDRYPVLVKINSDDCLEDGFCPDDMLRVAGMLEKAGVDAIELSGGTILAFVMGNPDGSFSRQTDTGIYYEDAAKRFKQEIGLPLMLVGGIRSYDDCQRLINEDVTDYISLGRPLIREPDLIKRWKSGDTRDADCVSDNACVMPGIEGKGVQCVHV